MGEKRRRDTAVLQAALASLPGPPDNAPGPFRARYAASVEALRQGLCHECQAQVTLDEVRESDQLQVTARIHHAPECSLSHSSMKKLAHELHYEWEWSKGGNRIVLRRAPGSPPRGPDVVFRPLEPPEEGLHPRRPEADQ
jgi:hypothetical protein